MIIGSIDLLLAPEGDNQDDDCFVMTWGIEDGEDNEKWNNDCRDYIVANANSDADYEMTIYIVFGMRECRWYLIVRDVDITAQMMMTTMLDLVRLVWGIAALNRPLSAISRCKKIIIIAVIHFHVCVTITIIIVSIKPLCSFKITLTAMITVITTTTNSHRWKRQSRWQLPQ